MTAQAAMIWCPFDSVEGARQAAEILVQEKLVACANILPELLSIFRYEGKVQSAGEVGVLFKTQASLLASATSRLSEVHPYETPAICGWLVDSAPPETREWLAELTAGEGK